MAPVLLVTPGKAGAYGWFGSRPAPGRTRMVRAVVRAVGAKVSGWHAVCLTFEEGLHAPFYATIGEIETGTVRGPSRRRYMHLTRGPPSNERKGQRMHKYWIGSTF